MEFNKISQQIYFDNSLEQWLIALAVSVVLFIVFFTLNKLFINRFKKFAERTHNQFDDLILELLSKTSMLLLTAASLYIGSLFLSVNEVIASIRKAIILIILLFQVAFWCGGLISYYINRIISKEEFKTGATVTQLKALGFCAKSIIWIIITLIIISNLGFNVTTLVTGLGIGGIAVALALQNMLSDVIASLSIILDKPFEIGDFIIIDDMRGNVENIGLKTTRVRSLSGEQLIFSNNDLLQSRIKNYKRMRDRRILFTLGVVYDTPHLKLKAIPDILNEIITQKPKTRFERAHFYSYGDFSLNFEIVYYVTNADYNDYMNAQQNINLEIYKRFKDEGIEFAYPTQTLFFNETDKVQKIKTDLRENNVG